MVIQLDGTRNVNREPTFYNLDAIISVGYRVSSLRATQFRSDFEKLLSDDGTLPILPFESKIE